MNKVKVISVIAVIILIVIVVVISVKKINSGKSVQTEEFVSTSPDGVRTNTSNKFHETKTFEGIEISNISLSENNGTTDLSATLKNVSDSKQGGYEIKLKIIDKDNNELLSIPVYVAELEPQATTEFITSARFDFANAYDFTVEKSEPVQDPAPENE